MNKATQKAFSEIYTNHGWGDNPVSGPGSASQVTAPLITQLLPLFAAHNIKSVLDMGCGDDTWARRIDWSGLGIKYMGCDIVPQIIEDNKAKYANTGMNFCVRDATTSNLPRYDLILWRDVATHLTNADAAEAVRLFVDSGASYLLATTFPETTVNKDIVTGGWRILNMRMEPFMLDKPTALLPEFSPDGLFLDKCMGLWPLQ